MSETDASSDSESEDLSDDILESRPAPIASAPPSRTVQPHVIKRTTLKNPGREKAQTQIAEPTTPPKDNPRKRRRSEMFASKENLAILPPADLFSPTSQRTNEKAQRGVLAESSPPRPSLLIPAGLNRVESPNKPINSHKPAKSEVIGKTQLVIGKEGVKEIGKGETRRDTPDFVIEFTLDEEGGGRRTSRARKQVNYALPNLRDKMRREDVLMRNEEKERGKSMNLGE